MTKYILGGGLSGLIAGYYNPEYTVLTDSFGGFINNRIARAFIYLHETEATRHLVTSLNVDSFVKELKIAYYHPEHGLQPKAPSGFAREYLERKIPSDWVPSEVELSAPGDEFRGIFVDQNLVDVLKEEVTYEQVRVAEVREDKVIAVSANPMLDDELGSAREFEWDRIVSTLPAPVFARFCDVDWKLESEPVTYAELSTVPAKFRTIPWNLLYIVDEVPYHRVMRNMLSGKYYVEMRGDFEWTGPAESIVHPTGVVHEEELEPPFEGIEFLGRFAEWSPEVRQDHVIERAKKGFE